jgi:hypothetical protein
MEGVKDAAARLERDLEGSGRKGPGGDNAADKRKKTPPKKALPAAWIN